MVKTTWVETIGQRWLAIKVLKVEGTHLIVSTEAAAVPGGDYRP